MLRQGRSWHHLDELLPGCTLLSTCVRPEGFLVPFPFFLIVFHEVLNIHYL